MLHSNPLNSINFKLRQVILFLATFIYLNNYALSMPLILSEEDSLEILGLPLQPVDSGSMSISLNNEMQNEKVALYTLFNPVSKSQKINELDELEKNMPSKRHQNPLCFFTALPCSKKHHQIRHKRHRNLN